MRAMYPDTEGFVERDGVKVGYEVFGVGRAGDPAVHPVGARARPALEGPGAVPGQDFTGDHRRGAGQRPGRPARGARGLRRDRVSSTTRSPFWTRRSRPGGRRRDCSSARHALLPAAPVSRPGGRGGTSRPRRRSCAAVAAVPPRLRRAEDTDEGWAKENRHYWLADCRGWVEFFFGELLRAAFHQAAGGRCGLGHGDQRGDASADRAGRCRRSCGEQTEAILARVRCPVLVIHGERTGASHGTGGERVAAITGGELLLLERAGHAPTVREPVASTCHPGLRRAASAPSGPPPRPRRRVPGPRPRTGPSGCSTSPRPSGSATPAVTWRSPTNCAGSGPGLQVHWLAQHPVTELLGSAPN